MLAEGFCTIGEAAECPMGWGLQWYRAWGHRGSWFHSAKVKCLVLQHFRLLQTLCKISSFRVFESCAFPSFLINRGRREPVLCYIQPICIMFCYGFLHLAAHVTGVFPAQPGSAGNVPGCSVQGSTWGHADTAGCSGRGPQPQQEEEGRGLGCFSCTFYVLSEMGKKNPPSRLSLWLQL